MNQPSTIDLLGRVDAVVFEADASSLRITFATGGALARLGFTANDCLQDPQFLQKRLHPDERQSVLALLDQVARDGQDRQLEHRLISADGSERWFRTEAHAVAAEDGTHLLGLMIDVTEARHTAEALRAAQTRLRQVVNNTPLVLMALDLNGVFTLAEGSGLKALNLTPGQAVGINIFHVYKDEPGILAHVRRALDGEAFTAYDQVLASGSWWETVWTPLFDANGQPAGATGVALDISDRKRAEDTSSMSMSLLRATLDATTDGILVVDAAGRFVDYNRRFTEMWRVPEAIMESGDDDRALGYAVEQLRDPDAFLGKVRALYAEPDAISHDVFELRDGRIFERNSRPQRVDGKSVGRVWSFRDITNERKATRRATFLAAASKVLAGPLGDATPLDVIARLTVPYLCDWVNILLLGDDGQMRSVAGTHVDADKVALVRRLTPNMSQPDRGIARVVTTGEPVVFNDITNAELAGDSRRGALSQTSSEMLGLLRALELRSYMAVPLKVRGKVIGVITFACCKPLLRYDDEDLTVAMDLAQRAAMALDNQRLYRASQQAVALRDEFLSVASHELRTPVTSLQLAVQSALAVGEEAPPGFLRQALESAERQTRRMGRLVDALLDVSRVQAGILTLSREPTDLVVLVREVVELLIEDARRAGCAVTIEGDENVVGSWDRARLEQVVTNLLSNAIKYGAGKPIQFTVRRDREVARLSVRDQGIGIAPSERERIFERFERAVSAKHYGGLGLGLYIVRRIIDAHRGVISIDSTVGEGTEFVVELPLQ